MNDVKQDVPLSKQLNIPPLWLIGMLLAIWLWDAKLPIFHFGGMLSKTVGATLIVGAMALAIWALLHFQKADTPVHPRRKPTALLTDGPYAYSRNPIYLAMVFIGIGAALCFGSLGAFVPVLAFVWIISDLFIEGEEFHINQTFGDDWKSYSANTRRWL